MNKQRREAIINLETKLEDIKFEILGLQEEEQEYYDNMPEPFQDSDKGEAAQTAIDCLESAVNSIIFILDDLAGARNV